MSGVGDENPRGTEQFHDAFVLVQPDQQEVGLRRERPVHCGVFGQRRGHAVALGTDAPDTGAHSPGVGQPIAYGMLGRIGEPEGHLNPPQCVDEAGLCQGDPAARACQGSTSGSRSPGWRSTWWRPSPPISYGP